ncbi:TerC/Alx family metal homeostasis membrane protein [Flavobacterium sp. DG1-102-2]|uniref:TerC/Alx family metal homeostasis membrane protein n=1 Tax=Flavobacterium sp. DG1-102-2 TaxID=3081663 RepID=UPI00294A5790|nr:TerC/Alx family metal homeostasis membrane protein [Flavobacterium sp. DG1-102-2]MDV6167222.1 TerC/Alx family metal homeostasis membrane protein [Flavobacterium sp. DG1-102-2]
MDNLINHPGLIAVFSVVIVVMLLLDLGVFNKNSHVVSNKEAIVWSIVWISLSMIFSGFIYYYMGVEKFSQFQSAYWIEKALSVDNLFVFILVFGFFNVPKENHHKVLFWGIIGALLLRAVFIFSGVGLIKLTYLPEMEIFGYNMKINVLLTLFGIFLIYAGIKSWFAEDDEDEDKDFNKSPGARVVHKFFSVSKNYDKDKFFTIENGKKLATPLLVVVGVIEFTDLLFAVDSIPAIFAIAPDDPFILYTSNIFAILGLRALYFLLANFIHLFSKLKYGLAIILAFIGVKMVISPLYHIESIHSLLVVAGVLIVSVLASVMFPEKQDA